MVMWRLRRVLLLVAVLACHIACLEENALGGIITSAAATSTYKLIYGTQSYEQTGSLPEYPATEGIIINNLAVLGSWTSPTFYNDTDGEYANLNFFQETNLQIVAPSPIFDATLDGVLSLEVRTVVTISFSESVKILSQSNFPIGDAWDGQSTTVVGTHALNEVVEPWLRLAFQNQTPLAARAHTLTFVSKVYTDSNYVASGSSSVVALSKFDVSLEFVPAPVPEPTSCWVTGVLFGSAVIGKRLRRRRMA